MADEVMRSKERRDKGVISDRVGVGYMRRSE